MNENNPDQGGDLRALLAMLRRRATVIAVAVVVGIVAALIYSNVQPKSYEGTAALLFRPLLLDVQATGLPLQVPGGDQRREAATNLALVELNEVRTRAAARLGPGYTPERIEEEVDISEDGGSNVVEIEASAPTPRQAARVANEVATAFVTFRRADVRDQVIRAADKVRGELERENLTPAARKALRLNLQRLTLLASVQTGDVQLIERAEPPSSASSPKPVRDVILGGVLGLLLGLGLALLSEQLDRRVRQTDQLEDGLGMPLLATVPRSEALRLRPDFKGDAAAAEEPFRRIRASLRHLDGEAERHSVLVTSASEGSGKTTVATHLAAAVAAGGHARVLLVEADLRRPRLAALLGLPPDRGLSRLLRSANPLSDGTSVGTSDDIFRIPLGGGSNGSGPNGGAALGFDALPAGPPPDDPSELLDSDEMRAFLRDARAGYDIVVIEAPPPTLVSDAIPLLRQVNDVLVVGRLGRESGPELRQLRHELERFGVTPVGVVANFSRGPNPYYYAESGKA